MRAATAREVAGPPALLVLLAVQSLPAQVYIHGRVVDENGAAVPSARIELHRPSPAPPIASASDSGGRFRFELSGPAECRIHAERHGFFVLEQGPVAFRQGVNQLTVTLNHLQELVESVDVVYSPPAIDPAEPSEQKQLNTVEILEVPYPASQDVRNALPLFQGVIKDHAGRLHFNGGSAEQVNYTVNGFNISDPGSGTFEARLNIDAVRALDLETSRFSAEKGRGSTASLDLKTGMGDDRWRFGGTNFIPGVTAQRGLYINKWTPRITLSGPLARGRAWFHNGFDAFYDVDVVRELPPGQDRSRSLTTSNLSRFQVNLTPAQILTGSFLVNYIDSNRAGLSFLDPVETTLDRRQNFFMSTVKHQTYFGQGALLELGFADSRGLRRETPQGRATFELSPTGRRGNYFAALSRHTGRQQWIANSFLPAWRAGGAHQLKLGFDLQRSIFDQESQRHDYKVLRAGGSTARHVTFAGSGAVRKTNFEPAFYVQDRWQVREGLLFELGLRADWDQVVRDTVFSPRLSIAWAPALLRDTKLAAGWGIFHDALNLGLLTRHQDQDSIARFFSPAGEPVRGPVRASFHAEEQSLRVPRSRTFSLTLERKLPLELYGRAVYVRRLGRDGLTFVSEFDASAPDSMAYFLHNWRNDRYDAIEIALRRIFAGQYEWSAGYTGSRARSDAVVEYSLENPIYGPQSPGPLDWDAPHRFLMWGWAPLPRRLPPVLAFLFRDTTAVYLVEARSGFPFSLVNEEGFLAGPPNHRRFPSYFSVNLHLERKFRFMEHLWAWRFGFNNLTNHGNPNVVNNNVDSPDFLTYARGQQRAFSVRLRFLGRR